MNDSPVAIVDYNCGNVKALASMLRFIGAVPSIVSCPRDLLKYRFIIIPGVGSFDYAVKQLAPFKDVLFEAAHKKNIKILGICVGMQILFESSEEGSEKGFGWLEGRLRKFNFDGLDGGSKLRVPHMGWNRVYPSAGGEVYFPYNSDTRFYFAHSYFVEGASEDQILATCKYGIQFPCSFNVGNITAVQFHPEKSHNFGIKFLGQYLNHGRI